MGGMSRVLRFPSLWIATHVTTYALEDAKAALSDLRDARPSGVAVLTMSERLARQPEHNQDCAVQPLHVDGTQTAKDTANTIAPHGCDLVGHDL